MHRVGGIGDTLTLTAFLHSLRPFFPRITLVGNAERLSLIDPSLHDEVLSADLAHRTLESRARDAALSVSFSTAPLPGFTRHFPPFPTGRVNVYEWMSACGVACGGEKSPYRPTPGTGRGTIIHPGSGSPRKNAPLPFFLERAKGIDAVFLLGPAEPEAMEETIRAAGHPAIRPATLGAMKAAIEARASFIGNDSGPAHIAALAGLACSIRYVDSDPAVWSPPGRVNIM